MFIRYKIRHVEVYLTMQEKFKKTFKKVAAIGTGIAMLGMTLTGAMAVDLSNYPSGLGYGGSDTIIVVGASASADNAAADSVAAGLPASSTTSGGVLVEGGQDYDVPLGSNIASSDSFDSELNDDDLECVKIYKLPLDEEYHDKMIQYLKLDVDTINNGATNNTNRKRKNGSEKVKRV